MDIWQVMSIQQTKKQKFIIQFQFQCSPPVCNLQ